MYFCANAKTGELVTRARTPGISSGDRPVYASPIVINGKIYAQTRTSGLYVIEPSDELKVIAQNKFESDDSLFNATPAVDSGQLFLRSYKFLYCVGTKPDVLAP
jgi:outer membrane protein assembly factor BamB